MVAKQNCYGKFDDAVAILNSGADTQTRTGDLTLTKGALYRAELYQHIFSALILLRT